MSHTSSFLRVLYFCLFSIIPAARGTDCSADAISKLLPSNSSLIFATPIAGPNGTFGVGAGIDLDFPANGTHLPSLCAVSVNVTHWDDQPNLNAPFTYGLFLPDSGAWNQRIITTGNTGFGGGINWPAMGQLVNYGFAAMSTNDGHNSGPNDASWARNNPEGLNNWGYRAMHSSIVMAKSLVDAYYGEGHKYSYFTACSGGGRQGLKDIQLYPEDFDGIVAGSPPWLLTHLHPWAAQVGLFNLPNTTAGYLDETDFSIINDAMIAQCDSQDGHTDNIISDPFRCSFRVEDLLCNSTVTTGCLSSAQADTFKRIYNDWVDPATNATIFPGFPLGSDASGMAGHDEPSSFGTQFIENMMYNDSNWNYLTFNASRDVPLADSINPGSGNADLFDLSAYRDAGGKMIMYHGLADPLIPPGSTLYYYQQVLEKMGSGSGGNSTVMDFYRLFFVPGMHHCSGSAGAPFYIAGGGQKMDGATHSVPGYEDSAHDVVLALMAWVENNTAPDSIVASKFLNNTASLGVERQRPLCPYPSMAQYVGGKGANFSDAASWECQDADALSPIPSIAISEPGSVAVPTRSTPAASSSGAAIPGGVAGRISWELVGVVGAWWGLMLLGAAGWTLSLW